MAIDNALFISEMDTNSPLNSDPRAEGAGQMRAIKRALQNSFPNINGEVTATPEQLNQVATINVTRGMIVDWYGEWDNPPENWAFCDGSTLTLDDGTIYTIPDLRDKFVKCVSFDDDGNVVEGVGDTGGDHDGIAKHEHIHKHSRGNMEIDGFFGGDDRIADNPTSGAFYPISSNAPGRGSEGSGDAGRLGFRASRSWSGKTSEPEDTTEIGTDGGNQPAYMVLAKIIFVGPYTI